MFEEKICGNGLVHASAHWSSIETWCICLSPLQKILTEVIKHNVDVFSTRVYFRESCDLNSSGVIHKLLAMHYQFLQKYFKNSFYFFH